MTEPTEISDRLMDSIGILRDHLIQDRSVSTKESRLGYEAAFDLMETDWSDMSSEMAMYREGYEQCLLDIVDAIADEWGVSLPETSMLMSE